MKLIVPLLAATSLAAACAAPAPIVYNADGPTPEPRVMMEFRVVEVAGIGSAATEAQALAALDAAELAGTARTLSAPRILALDRQKATMQVGSESDLRANPAEAGNAIAISATPRALAGSRVALDLDVVFQSLGTASGTPVIETRHMTANFTKSGGDRSAVWAEPNAQNTTVGDIIVVVSAAVVRD
jgi:Flp pilus assembly secretin CpaC